jgi:hypothetical protein
MGLSLQRVPKPGGQLVVEWWAGSCRLASHTRIRKVWGHWAMGGGSVVLVFRFFESGKQAMGTVLCGTVLILAGRRNIRSLQDMGGSMQRSGDIYDPVQGWNGERRRRRGMTHGRRALKGHPAKSDLCLQSSHRTGPKTQDPRPRTLPSFSHCSAPAVILEPHPRVSVSILARREGTSLPCIWTSLLTCAGLVSVMT